MKNLPLTGKAGMGVTEGTKLVRILANPEGFPRHTELACEMDTNVPNWLPAIERWSYHSPLKQPALLYIHRINSRKNRGDIKAEVWLDIPAAN